MSWGEDKTHSGQHKSLAKIWLHRHVKDAVLLSSCLPGPARKRLGLGVSYSVIGFMEVKCGAAIAC